MDPDDERGLGFGVEGDDELDGAQVAEPRTLAHDLAQAAISDLIPGGSILTALINHSHRRALEIAEELVERAADPAGYENLLARVQTDEEVAAIFRQAVDAATRTGDEAKRRMLGHIVSQAVLDDAKVDEATIFVSMLRNLDGPHLRALESVRRGNEVGHAEVNERLKRNEDLNEEDVAWAVGSHVRQSVGETSPTSLLPALIREGLLTTLQDTKPGVHPTNWKYVANDGTR